MSATEGKECSGRLVKTALSDEYGRFSCVQYFCAAVFPTVF